MTKWTSIVVWGLLVIAFCVSSFRGVFWISKSGEYSFELMLGAAIFSSRDVSAPSAYPAGTRGWHCATIVNRPPLFAYAWLPRCRVSYAATRLVLPLWLLFVLSAIPTSVDWLRCRVERRRTPPGHCESCKYDLTGNTSGICPECGTPIPDELRKKLANNEPEPTTDNPKQ